MRREAPDDADAESEVKLHPRCYSSLHQMGTIAKIDPSRPLSASTGTFGAVLRPCHPGKDQNISGHTVLAQNVCVI